MPLFGMISFGLTWLPASLSLPHACVRSVRPYAYVHQTYTVSRPWSVVYLRVALGGTSRQLFTPSPLSMRPRVCGRVDDRIKCSCAVDYVMHMCCERERIASVDNRGRKRVHLSAMMLEDINGR